MDSAFFCTRFNVLFLLLTISSPCKFIRSPVDFGPSNLLQSSTSASLDFGRMVFNSPSAVLRPQSVAEISQLLGFLQTHKVSVAARGAGHSIHGQAQALEGIVIEMGSLPSSIRIHRQAGGVSGFHSYADVGGGTLWAELLRESLKEGLAPRSWTDYLFLSVGGTLSNGGISGQTFKYGPQISNVLQLEVITGKGETVTCSHTQNSELFHAVLGGLGQFGIITRARILLQDAPKMVKWVRAFYDDFELFIKDQEMLVSLDETVDYVEGFMVLNEQSLRCSSVAFPSQLGFVQKLRAGSGSGVYYCIEFAVYYSSEKESNVDHVVEGISRRLNFMPTFIYGVEVPYLDFLNRVRMEEMGLRRKGLWDVPHPWLNMFVPRSGIAQFIDRLLENISTRTFEGHILIYPILRHKWDPNMSAVLPESRPADGSIVYSVGLLQSANPATCSTKCLQGLLQQNRIIWEAASHPSIGAKQYLPHYSQEAQWAEHFGGSWHRFQSRKFMFDPLHILSPGQAIFPRKLRENLTNRYHDSRKSSKDTAALCHTV